MYLLTKKLSDFVEDPLGAANEVANNFKNNRGYQASESEINSWNNSYPQIAKVLNNIPNPSNFYIYSEFYMPGCSTRADLIIIGLDANNKRVAIVIELKQWDNNTINNVTIEGTNLKVGNQFHLHPSEQALSYGNYLQELSEAFADKDCVIKTYAYLHNCESSSLQKLKDTPFDDLVKVSPIFAGNEETNFSSELSKYLKNAPDPVFIQEFEANKIKISKTLFNNVEKAIKEAPQWQLLDSQKVAYNEILKVLYLNDKEKHLILIQGEPGTGKSIIAMQIMGELCRKGISCVHITNSSSFTTVMKSYIMEKGKKQWNATAVNGLFKLSHNWVKNGGEFEVAICDEAHRFRKQTSLHPYLVSDKPQAQEIMENVRIFIAFIDERQILRKQEEGTVDYFINCAKKVGIQDKNIHGPIQLDVQFRCGGNADFVRVLDAALYENKKLSFSDKKFEVKFHDRVEDMENYLNGKINGGHNARVVAGFCWPWSDPDRNGNLIDDVVVGNWKRPWNAKAIQGKKYSPEEHPYTKWATRKNNQLGEVGCIYSVQGFEFDYIGVIWGEDLVWRTGIWVAQPNKSYDGEMRKISQNDALRLLKNAYRVLASRGLKGCSFVVIDEETKTHLKGIFGIS